MIIRNSRAWAAEGLRSSSRVSTYPVIQVSGVRNSWETLATKSRRVVSERSFSGKCHATPPQRPPPGHRSRVHLKRFFPVKRRRDGASAAGLALGQGRGHGRRALRGSRTECTNARPSCTGLMGDPLHDGIAPAHLSLGIDGNDCLLHAVEQCGQFAATAFRGRGKLCSRRARRHVERMGDGRKKISSRVAPLRPGQSNRRKAMRLANTTMRPRALGNPLRQHSRQQGRDDQREQRCHHDTAAQYVHRGRNVRGGKVSKPGRTTSGPAGTADVVVCACATVMTQGLVLIQNGGYFGRHGICSCCISRIGHQPPLGIEDGHFHLGRCRNRYGLAVANRRRSWQH